MELFFLFHALIPVLLGLRAWDEDSWMHFQLSGSCRESVCFALLIMAGEECAKLFLFSSPDARWWMSYLFFFRGASSERCRLSFGHCVICGVERVRINGTNAERTRSRLFFSAGATGG